MISIQKCAMACTVALCSLSMSAQKLSPQVLSDTQVMLRVPTSSKYLLLPVEESTNNDHIRVIYNNNVVRKFNVRLAVNKADYYVPLPLQGEHKGNLLLDITMNRGDAANSASKAATADFACWKLLQLSDTFNTKNREKFRPVYHHTPAYGWMNDPNGMFYKDGVWNIYFQHNPFGSQWENMTWGHSTSTDLINWKFEGEAILPDALGTIFSGCAVVDKNNTAGFGAGAVIVYYTSAGKVQKQCMAVSTDGGKTFTKDVDNPVLVSNIPDFRDPHIFWYEPQSKWILIVSEKQHMKIFSSKNLRDWTFESDFGEGYGSHDGVWECPDLIEVKNEEGRVKNQNAVKNEEGRVKNQNADSKWILICNINPGGPFGGSATQYFTGTFDGHKFTCDTDPSVKKWMDWGKDHYATVTFDNAPDGRHVAMTWMSNWQYANQVPTKQYRSANGIARDLGYFEYKDTGYVSVKPSPEVLAAFSKKPQASLSPACRVDVQLHNNATITLSNGKGERVVMTYNAAKETFSMDRTKSGDVSFSTDFPAVTKAPTRGRIKTLQLFIDKSSIEAFDADGKMAMTNIVFPSSPYTSVTVKGGKAKVYALK
jgi:fructan beta-fructosidase